MLIQCTKALLDKIGINRNDLKSPEGYENLPDSLKAWHANVVSINRKKAIVLVNNETRYSVVIYRPKPKDFKRIKKLIKEGIITALRMEGIREDVIKNYMADAKEIEFSKTANRSMVAKMNNSVHEIQLMQEYLDDNTLVQKYISIITGRYLQKAPTDEMFRPIDRLKENLSVYCGNDKNSNQKDILDVDLYQIKIKIEIEGFDIWRKVLVPSKYSFRHLHNIIQTVYDWQNYHLHVFEVKKNEKMDKMIVMDDYPETLEWLEFDKYDVLQEGFTALEDIFCEYKEISYEYDFGSSWEHTIILEKVIRSNEFKVTFLGGKGERPPEDVGGASGYDEYMRIMADETDPEYDDMKAWSESQKERKLSQKKINDRLRDVMWGYFYFNI